MTLFSITNILCIRFPEKLKKIISILSNAQLIITISQRHLAYLLEEFLNNKYRRTITKPFVIINNQSQKEYGLKLEGT